MNPTRRSFARRPPSRRLIATVLALAALPLAGCVEIQSDSAAQQAPIGEVVVTTEICASQATEPCDRNSTYSNDDADDPGQLLIAYRLPTGVTPPATISVARADDSLTLASSPSYTQQLTDKAAPGNGFKWAGYISPNIATSSLGAGAPNTVTARFKLARGHNGAPYPHATLAWRTVAGYRVEGTPEADPVVCADPPTAGAYTDAHSAHIHTRCIDSPEPDHLTNNPPIPVKDLGVLDGSSPVTAKQGQAISVPFTIRTTGDDLPLFDLSGGSTAPNTQVTPSTSSFAPAPGDETVPVSVNVGANTPPGVYDVKLTARVGGVQQRSGTIKLKVVAPEQPRPEQPPAGDSGAQQQEGDRIPPEGTFSLARGQALAAALRRGVVFKGRCSEACGARLTLKRRGKVVASGTAASAAPGSFAIRAKFKRAAKRKLRASRSLKLSARLVVRDNAGLIDATTGSVKLTR